ncbi:MAG: putative acyl-CoA dehydrogenase [Aeromicrobium sp.]|nr:putative acyl-CoA dehydrogenase [Aeromicrobium sp.]
MSTVPEESIEAVRSRVRDFLASAPAIERGEARLASVRAWYAALYEAGLAAPSWPAEHGGMGLTVREQLAYHEELTRGKAPSHPSAMGNIVAPTIIAHGTDEQRARFLPPLLRTDELWCQGFSEPGAGSDLPSLTTRATLDGDAYVVNGQKVWTSGAHVADWMFTLVRTGPAGSRTRGITYLLIPMDAPGLSVRPLKDIAGGTHFSEVFLDDVRVPVSQRIGEENEGWNVTRTSLGYERTTMSSSSDFRYRRIVTELFELAERQGRLDEQVVRQELAHLVTAVRILAAHAEQSLAAALAGEKPGNASSGNRLFRAEFEQRLHEFALSLLGPAATLGSRDPDAIEKGRWTWGYLSTRASTIGAGTSEVQRNAIAEKVLGMPRSAPV